MNDSQVLGSVIGFAIFVFSFVGYQYMKLKKAKELLEDKIKYDPVAITIKAMVDANRRLPVTNSKEFKTFYDKTRANITVLRDIRQQFNNSEAKYFQYLKDKANKKS